MLPSFSRPRSLLIATVVLLVAACQGPPTGSAPAAPSAGSSATATKATFPAAPPTTSGRKEVVLVAGPRKRLEDTFVALQKSDIPAARSAFEAYNGEWNGVEVYVNVRSRALYGEIETHYEADVAKALEAPNPDPAQILPLMTGMVAQYDEAIKLSDSGPALSPLFEDVATIRIVRAPLRTVSPALKAGSLAKAQAGFAAFKSRWPEVQPLFQARSPEAAQETVTALAQADAAMSAATVNPATAGPQVDALSERFNYGLNLVNTAARNADLTRTTFSDQDLQTAAVLGATAQELKDSLTAWESGDYVGSSDRAVRAAGPRLERVTSTLQAKGGADAPLQKALEAYRTVAAQPGDAAAVRAANKAAIEAVAVAQQAVVGQFWTDSAFKDAYQRAMSATG